MFSLFKISRSYFGKLIFGGFLGISLMIDFIQLWLLQLDTTIPKNIFFDYDGVQFQANACNTNHLFD